VLWSGEITPSVNPQNGYYEVHIEPGEWRVGGQASPQLRAAFPSTTECLMMLEDFLPPNTESYAQIPYQDSRRGIIQDLVWNPTPWFAWKCAKASRAARGLQ
jgi:hypothetical protein